jgi:hypothetical protein
VEFMDITIEDSDILARICKDVNLTPKKLFEDYIASLTHLYYTYEQFRNEGNERRTFSEILSKLHQQMLESIPSNLDLVPSLIEQTNKLVRIDQSNGASVSDLLIDYDDRIVSYSYTINIVQTLQKSLHTKILFWAFVLLQNMCRFRILTTFHWLMTLKYTI